MITFLPISVPVGGFGLYPADLVVAGSCQYLSELGGIRYGFSGLHPVSSPTSVSAHERQALFGGSNSERRVEMLN